MHNIFIRIYMGMILAMIAIMLLVSLVTYYVNKHRITTYVEQYYGGTFRLIAEGVARHKGEQQAQWLSAIEKLSDLTFQKHSTKTGMLTKQQLITLQEKTFLFQIDNKLSVGQVFISLKQENNYLKVNLSDFSSSLVRLSAFLVLNEIGRHKSEQRLIALKELRKLFNYPIQLKPLDDLQLSNNNIRTIKQGNVVVVLNNLTTSTPSLMAYAPLGNSPYALVLGSIPLFEWFPFSLIASIIAAILLLMAAASFFLVRPLEKRLAVIDQQIEQIGHDKQLLMTTPASTDAIGKLSNTVNSMSIRIHKLIDAQNDMIRAITHELRTPITRIRFRLAMLEDQQESSTAQQVEGIIKDLSELENLVDEVLTFAKLKHRSPNLIIENIALIDMFKRLQQSANTINKHIKIIFPQCNNIYVQADQRYLFRALENLLLNALKYAKQHIEISYEISTSYQKISIADDGPGIPVTERDKVLEPFSRVDSSRDRQSGGYGLGLAIVQQIANWHQGSVKISTSKQGGAKITFIWPITLYPNHITSRGD